MQYFLNPSIFELERNRDSVLLKNSGDETLFFISKDVFEILSKYSKFNSVSEISKDFQKKNIECSPIEIVKSIEFAKEKNILIKNVDEAVVRSHNRFETLLMYMFGLLRLKKIGFNVILKGGFKFYRIVSLPINESWRVFTKMKNGLVLRSVLMSIPLLIIFFASYFFVSSVDASFEVIKDTYIQSLYKTSISWVAYLLFVFVGTSIALLFHEFGHYLMYRLFKGKNAELGFATVHVIIPIFYVSTNSVYFWKGRKGTLKKILVSLSGVYFDFFFLSILFLIGNFFGGDDASFTLIFYTVTFAVFGRIILSLNPFMIQSDGYFILGDSFNIDNLFEKSLSEVKKMGKIKYYKTDFNFKSVMYFLYLLLSSISIVIYWGIMIYFVYQIVLLFL